MKVAKPAVESPILPNGLQMEPPNRYRLSMRLLVQCALVALTTAVGQTELAAVPSPDSLLGRSASTHLIGAEVEPSGPVEANDLASILLRPAASFRMLGKPEATVLEEPTMSPAPPVPPALGRSTGWIIGGAVLAAFVSFTVILVSASAND